MAKNGQNDLAERNASRSIGFRVSVQSHPLAGSAEKKVDPCSNHFSGLLIIYKISQNILIFGHFLCYFMKTPMFSKIALTKSKKRRKFF